MQALPTRRITANMALLGDARQLQRQSGDAPRGLGSWLLATADDHVFAGPIGTEEEARVSVMPNDLLRRLPAILDQQFHQSMSALHGPTRLAWRASRTRLSWRHDGLRTPSCPEAPVECPETCCAGGFPDAWAVLVGQAGISTPDQSPALQRDAPEAAGRGRIFEKTASGARRDRPQLQAALDWMREGYFVLGDAINTRRLLSRQA